MNQFLWITNTPDNKAYYSDWPKKGLSVSFASSLPAETRFEIQHFLRYLRRDFYFPVKCSVYFTDHDRYISKTAGFCYGIFFPNDGEERAKYPQIFVPARMDLHNIRHSLCYELTRYFQWYFKIDEQKTGRSLSAQAGYYAKRVIEDYYEEYVRE